MIEQPILTSAERLTIFRDKINAAVDAHIANGGKIVSLSFGCGTNECCPIGALIGKDYDLDQFIYVQVANKLGFYFTNDDMWSFIEGFDNDGMGKITNMDLFSIGVKLRTRINPTKV
jgi:hypothetical protein